jgi:hypothetical protein
MMQKHFRILTFIILVFIYLQNVSASFQCEDILIQNTAPYQGDKDLSVLAKNLAELELSFATDNNFHKDPIYQTQVLKMFEMNLTEFIKLGGEPAHQEYLRQKDILLKNKNRNNRKSRDADKQKNKKLREQDGQTKNLIILPVYIFEKTRELQLDSPKRSANSISYNKAAAVLSGDRLLINAQDNMIIYDLKTDQRSYLPKTFKAVSKARKLLSDRQRVGMLDVENKTNFFYRVIDLNTQEIKSSVELKLNGFVRRRDGEDFEYLDVSPDEEYLAVGGLGTVFIIEAKTGKVVAKKDNLNPKGQTSSLVDVIFYDNESVIYGSDFQVFKFNFKTNQILNAEFPDKLGLYSTFGLDLSYDKKIIFVAKFDYFISIDAESMKIISRGESYEGNSKQTSYHHFIPGDYRNHIVVVSRDTDSYNIYETQDYKKVFDFDSKYKKTDVMEIIFSENKEKAYVFYGKEDGEVFLDSWNLKQQGEIP